MNLEWKQMVMQIPGVLMAFTFHEFGHAWVATLFGDDSPRRAGRVTLDPRVHLDPIGTLLLFIVGFGWAKPVWVDVHRLRPRVLGDIAVSLAGVAMNFLLAVLFYTLLVLSYFGVFFDYHNPVLDETLLLAFNINVILIVFNLIPIPPLDGFRVARYLFPSSMDALVSSFYRFGPLLLMLLLFTPVFRQYLTLAVSFVSTAIEAMILPVLEPLVSAIKS